MGQNAMNCCSMDLYNNSTACFGLRFILVYFLGDCDVTTLTQSTSIFSQIIIKALEVMSMCGYRTTQANETRYSCANIKRFLTCTAEGVALPRSSFALLQIC